MNRDTLYSLGVVDISKGATVTMLDAGKRHMSLMIINNDGYVDKVFYGGGAHELTVGQFDTPFFGVVIRTLANPEDPADLAAARRRDPGGEIDITRLPGRSAKTGLIRPMPRRQPSLRRFPMFAASMSRTTNARHAHRGSGTTGCPASGTLSLM
jgi:hypothetical protein